MIAGSNSFFNCNILSVIIPFFNEEQGIPIVLKDIANFEKKNSGLVLEYIFIDDGSLDNSLKILNISKNKLSNSIKKKIKIVKNSKNYGFAKKLIQGFNLAKGRYIIPIVSDGEIRIEQFFDKIEFKNDLLILQRKTVFNRPVVRITLSYLYRFLIAMIFFVRVLDFNGILVIKKSIIKKLNVCSNSHFINAEIIIKSTKLGYLIDVKKYLQTYVKDVYKSNSLSILQFIRIFIDIYKTRQFIKKNVE
jgi:glycosyltransferase involved in cell wall biosynthesis